MRGRDIWVGNLHPNPSPSPAECDLVRARDIGSVTFTLTLALALALALSLTLGARPSLGGRGAQRVVSTLGPRLARARVTLRSRARRRARVTLTMARVRVTLSMVRVRVTRHGVARATYISPTSPLYLAMAWRAARSEAIAAAAAGRA